MHESDEAGLVVSGFDFSGSGFGLRFEFVTDFAAAWTKVMNADRF